MRAGAAALTAALSCDTLSPFYLEKTHSIIASYRDIYSHYTQEHKVVLCAQFGRKAPDGFQLHYSLAAITAAGAVRLFYGSPYNNETLAHNI